MWLTFFTGALRIVTFKRIVSRLGLAQCSPDKPVDVFALHQDAYAMGWAVRAVAARMPWLTDSCLVQALAGMQMLRRRKAAGMLTLGVMLDSDKTERLEAHAWLRHGAIFLTGEANYRLFTPISAYVFSPTASFDNGESPR